MKNTIYYYAIYFLTSLLFFIAFIVWHPSQMRWVFFFCGFVFGILGLTKLIRMKRN